MVERKLVSLLIPCYNSEKYVDRLLDSILVQTYPAIEVIAVDDGSDDRTTEVVEGYMPRFEERGYELKLLRQKHGGQSEAINNALKVMRGEYFAWPDSDDYYASAEAIEKMVRRLEAADEEVGVVRCLPIYRDESGREVAGLTGGWGNLDKEWLFEDAILERNGFVCLSGGFLVKTEAFDRVVKGRNIATALNAGQNWQLLLPVLYSYRCVTVKERLHTVVFRPDSHSRGQYADYDSAKSRLKDFLKVMMATLDGIEKLPGKEKAVLKRRFLIFYHQRLLRNAFNHRKRGEIRRYFSTLKAIGRNLPKKEKMKYRLMMMPGGVSLLKIVKFTKNRWNGRTEK